MIGVRSAWLRTFVWKSSHSCHRKLFTLILRLFTIEKGLVFQDFRAPNTPLEFRPESHRKVLLFPGEGRSDVILSSHREESIPNHPKRMKNFAGLELMQKEIRGIPESQEAFTAIGF